MKISSVVVLSVIAVLGTTAAQESRAQTPQGTAREAYLEGWFQETAEGNLEAALAQYRQAVAIGTGADREVVARALLRIAMITRAQGQEDEAKKVLAQLATNYADTRAAAQAQEAQTAPPPDTAATRETEAVREAREALKKLIGGGLNSREETALLRSVFVNLSLDEIVEHYRATGMVLFRRGQSLDWWLLREVRGKALKYGLAVHDWTVAVIVEHLFDDRNQPLQKEVLDLIPSARRETACVLFGLLSRRQDDMSMDALMRLVEDNEFFKKSLNPLEGMAWATLLAENPRDEAAVAMDRLLERLAQDPSGRDYVFAHYIPLTCLLTGTPASARCREELRSCSAAARHAQAKATLSIWAKPELREAPGLRACLDLFLSDPEPLVRKAALLSLVQSGNQAFMLEALERQRTEPVPTRIEILKTACSSTSPIMPPEPLLEAAEGDLLEFVYRSILGSAPNEPRHPMNIVRLGLERGDPELLQAGFTPITSRLYGTGIGALLPNTHISERMAAASDIDVVSRLVRAAATSPDIPVRRAVPEFVRRLPTRKGLEFYPDLAAADTAPQVRLSAVESLAFDEFSEEQQLALLLDRDFKIFYRAVGQCSSENLLEKAARELEVGRLPHVFYRASALESVPALRVLFRRLPPHDQVTWQCYEFLSRRDPETVIETLQSPDENLRSAARKTLGELRLAGLDDALARFVEQTPAKPSLDEASRLAAILRDHSDLLTEAFRRRQIAEIVEKVEKEHPTAQSLGSALAGLQARDELRELVAGEKSHAIQAGAWGLAILGEREALAEALRFSSEPVSIVEGALQVGLEADVVALTREGRTDFGWSVSRLLEAKKTDALIDLVLSHPEEARAMRGLDQRIANVFAERKDAKGLSQIVQLYADRQAVTALVQLGAFEEILSGIASWDDSPRSKAVEELRRLTGLPKDNVWPAYQVDQEALVQAWREALARRGP
ncbi:MAG: hypothetical protein AB1486_21160 [Planctomycetota bacterium]